MTSAILQGLWVLELGQVLGGPFAGALFADLGADVVRFDRAESGIKWIVSDEAAVGA